MVDLSRDSHNYCSVFVSQWLLVKFAKVKHTEIYSDTVYEVGMNFAGGSEISDIFVSNFVL